MNMLIRNILMIPLIIVFRLIPMTIFVVLEQIVKLGYKYQEMLNLMGIGWKNEG